MCVHPGSSKEQCGGKSEDDFHARNFHRTGWQWFTARLIGGLVCEQ